MDMVCLVRQLRFNTLNLTGRRDEARDDYLGEMSERYKWIVFASDWYGKLSGETLPSSFSYFTKV
jgi:hypothetical protein